MKESKQRKIIEFFNDQLNMTLIVSMLTLFSYFIVRIFTVDINPIIPLISYFCFYYFYSNIYKLVVTRIICLFNKRSSKISSDMRGQRLERACAHLWRGIAPLVRKVWKLPVSSRLFFEFYCT